jgi:hypothetical protein
MTDDDKVFLHDAIEAHKIDLQFLNDKYGIVPEMATEIIQDIVKGNLESKPYKPKGI